MPWTTPPTKNTGDIVTPGEWNTYIRDDLNFLHQPPYCQVYLGSDVSIPNNAATAIAWDTELSDLYGMHSGTSANVTIPAGAGGTYLLCAATEFVQNGTGYRLMDVLVNGTHVDTAALDGQSATGTILRVVKPHPLNAGDVVTVAVTQTSGGALLVSAATGRTFLSVLWVSV